MKVNPGIFQALSFGKSRFSSHSAVLNILRLFTRESSSSPAERSLTPMKRSPAFPRPSSYHSYFRIRRPPHPIPSQPPLLPLIPAKPPRHALHRDYVRDNRQPNNRRENNNNTHRAIDARRVDAWQLEVRNRKESRHERRGREENRHKRK